MKRYYLTCRGYRNVNSVVREQSTIAGDRFDISALGVVNEQLPHGIDMVRVVL